MRSLNYDIVVEFERVDKFDGLGVYVLERIRGQHGATEWGPMKPDFANDFIDARKAEIAINVRAALQRLHSKPFDINAEELCKSHFNASMPSHSITS